LADPAWNVLASLCERALARTLEMEGLEKAWPEPVEDSALVPLREALEYGVEHTPRYRGKPGVNLKAWQRMLESDDIHFYLRGLRGES
jgi:hypothetical protein